MTGQLPATAASTQTSSGFNRRCIQCVWICLQMAHRPIAAAATTEPSMLRGNADRGLLHSSETGLHRSVACRSWWCFCVRNKNPQLQRPHLPPTKHAMMLTSSITMHDNCQPAQHKRALHVHTVTPQRQPKLWRYATLCCADLLALTCCSKL